MSTYNSDRKQLEYRSANRGDGIHLDIVEEKIWGHDWQRAAFDIIMSIQPIRTYVAIATPLSLDGIQEK